MQRKSHLAILAAAGLAGVLATVAAAPPSSPGNGNGHPNRPNPPISNPMPSNGNHPSNLPKTSPSPATGRATSAPDTDRGRSEGKGHTDTAGTTRLTATVVSVSGNTVVVKLPDGTTQTLTLNANVASSLKAGTQVILVRNGSRIVSVMPANQSITGTVVSSTKTTVTLRLPNGRTQTISVAPAAAAHMNLTPGSKVTLISNNGGQSVIKILPQHPNQRRSPAPGTSASPGSSPMPGMSAAPSMSPAPVTSSMPSASPMPTLSPMPTSSP